MQDLRYILNLIRQNLTAILLGTLLGIALASAINFFIPVKYKTSALFRLREDLTPLNYGGIVRVAPLRMLLQNGVNLAATADLLNRDLHNPTQVARTTRLSTDICKHIKGVNAAPPKPQQPESNNFWGDVYVTLTLDSPELPPDSLTAGLHVFLSNTQYLSEQFAQRQQFFSTQLAKLRRDQRQLDSLRMRASPADVAALTSVAANLYKEETELNERIKNNRLHTILPFGPPSPTGPYAWGLVLVVGAATGFIITLAAFFVKNEFAKTA